jgi:micrococcal nuclease
MSTRVLTCGARRLSRSGSASRRVLVTVIVALCWLLTAPLAGAQASSARGTPASIEGIVARVSDGDTFVVRAQGGSYVVRLHGIDAPEDGQAYGHASSDALSRLVFGKTVQVRVVTTDRYDRLVGKVWVAGQDVGLAMVAGGHAWHYRAYSNDRALAQAQAAARRQGVGLWSSADARPPWEYRRSQGARAGASPPRGVAGGAVSGLFRGNAKSLVYHRSGCRHFNCANCVTVFRSAAEAERAGYRPHAECVRAR